jgi:putative membrane protein
MVKEAAIVVGVFTVLAVLFLMLQKKGFWARLLNLLSIVVSKDKLQGLATDAKALDDAILDVYACRGRIFYSCLWRLAGWFSGAIEVWIALYFLGAGSRVTESILLESLGQVIRGAAFLVPGAFGVQEGGFVILGNLVGLSPEIALGMSLSKRFRELILGIPGLILWQIEEGRLIVKRNRVHRANIPGTGEATGRQKDTEEHKI